MSKRYTQRYDGDTIRIRNRAHVIRCCDCGLVHLFKFKIDKSTLSLRVWRLLKNTASSRRGRKYRGLRLPKR